MTLRALASALLALPLTAPVVHGQTAPAAIPKPAANAVDPASIQALKDMGTYPQSLNRFRASTALTGERVLADRQKLQHAASATVDAARPSKLRARMWSARFMAVGAAIAVTSAVIGSMVNTVPVGCIPVNYGGMVYQQCGSTWYQPQGSQLVVVGPPY